MTNAWKVIWYDDDRKFLKRFEGDSPRESGAIEFGKSLQSVGIKSIHIVSQRKAFAPPKDKLVPPEHGMLWCPYCLKWKTFIETSIMDKDGIRSPIDWRCPVCTISIRNFYVRRYNLEMVLRFEGRAEMQSENKIRRNLNGNRRG